MTETCRRVFACLRPIAFLLVLLVLGAAPAQAQTADLSVTKSDTPDPVFPGANIIYTIMVANAGPSAAASVAMNDVIPASTTFVSFTAPAGYTSSTPAVGGTGTITATIPSLAPGTVSTFTLVVNVNAATPGGTVITNTSTVSTTTSDPNTANNTDTETTAVTQPAADLTITKADTPDPVLPGSNITHTITVANAGPSAAASVAMNDVIPASTTFVSFTAPAGYTSSTPAVGGTGTITATIPSLAPGTVSTFTLVVNVNAATPGGTVITNTSTVSTTTSDPNTANNTDTETTAVTQPAPDLTITKADTPDPVLPGSNITYTITVANAGPSAAASVAMNDVIPASTTFVSFTAPAGYTSSTPAVGGTGTITATIPSLAPGTVSTFTLVVNVNAATPGGTVITNTSTVSTTTSDPNTANNTDTETTVVAPPTADLSVTKTDTSDPVFPGANITYTIMVANAGPGAAANVTMNDLVPANTTFVSFTAPAGYTSTTPPVGGIGAINATIGSLAPGTSSVFTLVVNVNSATLAGTTITNTATVSSATADVVLANNSDTESTTVAGASADLSVTKTDAPDPVVPGQTITFTYTVTNTGPSAAANVALTDAVPANTTFVSFTAPAGFTSTTPPVGGTGAITSTTPSMAAGQTVTFTFVVQVDPATPAGTIITGTATASSATTDPNAANNTATSTTTVAAAVPTMLQWQLLALAVLIGLIAVSQLRRRTQALS